MSVIAEEKTVQSLTQSGKTENQESTAQKSEDTVIAIRGLTKVFKDFWGRPKAKAVDNVSFEVRKGEVFGLLGPNGSGKSTTIKMILGLLYPTKGHLEVFGKSPRHVATKERIGYLPEESYLYRYLNSVETLDFFGSLFRLSQQERKDRIEQLLDMVGLSAARRRAVGEFSKGMQRRIGIAQSLINDPDLVILDEPTSGLDPIGCREVKDLILALAKRGKTVILSSHLLSDVEDVCDRVVIYYGGKVQAMGELGDLLATPDSMQIQTPLLSKSVTEKVLETIRKEVGEGKVRLETPTQNLESYFLGVVERARQTDQHTSGALSGARVAEYLRSQEQEEPASEKILQRLTSAYEETVATQKQPEQTQEEKALEQEEIVQKKVEKLEALTQGPAEVKTSSEVKEAAAKAEPVEVIDVSKLSSLTQADEDDAEEASEDSQPAAASTSTSTEDSGEAEAPAKTAATKTSARKTTAKAKTSSRTSSTARKPAAKSKASAKTTTAKDKTSTASKAKSGTVAKAAPKKTSTARKSATTGKTATAKKSKAAASATQSTTRAKSKTKKASTSSSKAKSSEKKKES